MAVLDWPLGCTCCIGENGLHGTASFTVFLKRTALTGEKRHPFLDPETICFLTPPTPIDKLLRAELVVGSVTTSESSVLYVSFLFTVWNIQTWMERSRQTKI
jgi:hypothetical protein